MKNAFYLLLCTLVLGCIGGRSVNTTVQQIEPLRPIQLDNSPLVIKPLALNPPVPKPAKVEPTYKGPDIVLESAKPTPIPLTPVPAQGASELELKPIEIKPIDLTPLPPVDVEVLPELEVEQIELKEIELPKPVHVKVLELLLFYGIAGLLLWLCYKWWLKRKASKLKRTRRPVSRRRKKKS